MSYNDENQVADDHNNNLFFGKTKGRKWIHFSFNSTDVLKMSQSNF